MRTRGWFGLGWVGKGRVGLGRVGRGRGGQVSLRDVRKPNGMWSSG